MHTQETSRRPLWTLWHLLWAPIWMSAPHMLSSFCFPHYSTCTVLPILRLFALDSPSGLTTSQPAFLETWLCIPNVLIALRGLGLLGPMWHVNGVQLRTLLRALTRGFEELGNRQDYKCGIKCGRWKPTISNIGASECHLPSIAFLFS